MANWLVFASWVISAVFAGFPCPEIIGAPDGVGVWQWMEYHHGIRLEFDGWQFGGVTVYITETQQPEYQFMANVAVVYMDGNGERMFYGSSFIPPGGGAVSVPGPDQPWKYAILQGGNIYGFVVDAVQVGRQWRTALPIVGVR